MRPNKLIVKATRSINRTKTLMYGIASEKLEAKSIASKQFKEVYDFYRLQKVKKDAERRSRYDNKKRCKI